MMQTELVRILLTREFILQVNQSQKTLRFFSFLSSLNTQFKVLDMLQIMSEYRYITESLDMISLISQQCQHVICKLWS